MRIEEEYMDVLHNIETMILGVYREDPTLLDYDVEAAITALISCYRARQIDREPKPLRLTDRAEEVYNRVHSICEWRLGKEVPEIEGALPEEGWISIEELLNCLKRIKKSVQTWTKQAGRQGYLNFVNDYIP
jgi:hypothetical protein